MSSTDGELKQPESPSFTPNEIAYDFRLGEIDRKVQVLGKMLEAQAKLLATLSASFAVYLNAIADDSELDYTDDLQSMADLLLTTMGGEAPAR